jgi:uncharacterized protein (TIGR02246 family)
MRNPRLAGPPAGACLALLWCAFAIGCAPAAPVDNSAEARQAIEAVNQRFMEMVEKKDAAGLASLYTEDAKLLPQGAPAVEGRAAIQREFEGMLQAIARLDLKTVEVEGHGDTAHELESTALYDASGAKVDEGKAIVIWKKVGENWQLHRDIFNSNLPPPPPPAAPAEGAGAPAEGAEAPAADATEAGTSAPPG